MRWGVPGSIDLAHETWIQTRSVEDEQRFGQDMVPQARLDVARRIDGNQMFRQLARRAGQIVFECWGLLTIVGECWRVLPRQFPLALTGTAILGLASPT